jgi:5-methylcytosine-specific restriction endonuclease McrBC regulatory subunit McrC
MGWVADERGLGGARTLDGLAWDLEVAAVWESWVRRFAGLLAPQLGLRAPGPGESRRPLRWEGGVSSMGALAPDVGLVGNERVVWIDAKYKAHLSLLARHGWRGVTDAIRDAHRADLHQALAYAAIADVDRVDTVLLYPHLGTSDASPPTAIATVASGRRRVRLVLGGLPFGFGTPARCEAAIRSWRTMLAT